MANDIINGRKVKTVIMDADGIDRTLTRLAHEIYEREDISNLILVGILRRGYPIAESLGKKLKAISGKDVPVGKTDITFYRDDLTKSSESPTVKATALPISTEGKTVVLVDDVLFTGRTCRAAIDAVMGNGRPDKVRLAVLIDRGHRELPIRADYVGKSVPTSRKEQIAVLVKEYDGEQCVKLIEL